MKNCTVPTISKTTDNFVVRAFRLVYNCEDVAPKTVPKAHGHCRVMGIGEMNDCVSLRVVPPKCSVPTVSGNFYAGCVVRVIRYPVKPLM